MIVQHLALSPLTPSDDVIPLFVHSVEAGFPSPADDHIEQHLNLHELMVTHPAATYLCRGHGDSMTELGIGNGDLLVVDRSIKPKHGSVVIAAVDGQFTCKVLDLLQRRLLAANAKYASIPILEDMELMIEGVVTYSIRCHL
jgi:DNA polymerase V